MEGTELSLEDNMRKHIETYHSSKGVDANVQIKKQPQVIVAMMAVVRLSF